MNSFEQGLLRYLSPADLEKIRAVRVGIAGAGGLGSNCAQHLVRCGFRAFTLVDHDCVDDSNLNRQFFFMDQVGLPKVDMLGTNLRRINPDLDLRLEKVRIDRENMGVLFGDCQVIVEAFDGVASKTMLVEQFMNSEKLLVTASGLGGFGTTDAIHVRKIRARFFMVGDFISEVNEHCPPLSPRTGIVAAKQADVVLRVVTGREAYDEKTM
ncbi:MAG: sulfur carrier protein ThiS adenylyltransferase ThiF [Proteobacteria bacterium]|nr:sulfur carrier protein ThiS adenylyltransferase ThiF [Pseudomonadota bacterium]